MECTNDVLGMRCVGGQRRKGSEWWNEEVGRAVAEKLLRNGFREETGLPGTGRYPVTRSTVLKRNKKNITRSSMTGTGHREWL